MKFENETLVQFLKDVYNGSSPTILSSEEIKEIEYCCKLNYEKYPDIKAFYASNKKVAKNIKKLKSVRAEVERQFEAKENLQNGAICECVLAGTIAKMYGLNDFADVFHTYVRFLPANIIYRLRDDNNQILCRYIYYDKNNLDTFLIQYGNPTGYDADLYINGQIVKLEFKDRLARVGEVETAYDNSGKLIWTPEFAAKNPSHLPIIEKFNETNNIIDLTGNYPIDNKADQKAILKAYFKNLGVETLVSSDDKGQLIAVTQDCIEGQNNKEILSLNGSEIRRAGKNNYDVFTKELLYKSIEKIGGEISGENVKVPTDKMSDRVAKGKGKISGKKINHFHFVPIDFIEDEKNGYYSFSISNVRQLKPTICSHMKILYDKSELKDYYKDILG